MVTGSRWSTCSQGLSWLLVCCAALAVVTGCSSSAKEELTESTNKKCETITERFTGDGDLAYGQSISAADEDKMRERAALIRDLRRHVQDYQPPESERFDLKGWMSALDAYAKSLKTMRTDYLNARQGDDLLLAMSAAVVEEKAEATGTSAQSLGLESCTRVKEWEKIGK
ncbi:hypothetical protein MMF93_33160 [Streptomyces tubbatahanensis]|uniref:Lipoprotein n=1 Tax=Streptomyces tubbatahanensis TaxID=2923272 RepID=A0ABY3Y1T7_9ACTN|nr:hypothetical protein [Streptomyces tubbatahanensis]UNT00798.1 hypothetical protein MMF93_33160 [Streptomyces tubbatahanensis]